MQAFFDIDDIDDIDTSMIHSPLTPDAAARAADGNPLLRQAFDYLLAHWDDLRDPAMNGRYALDGDRLFLLVGDHALKEPGQARLEVHDRYIDIQAVIDQAEDYGWSPRAACVRPVGEMDREKDILFFDDVPQEVVTVRPGEFVLFYPEDAHAPLRRPVDTAGQTTAMICRKVIVKCENR